MGRIVQTRAIVVGLAISLAALAGIAHLPPVRSIVLHRLIDALGAYGVDAHASGLDYNLFTLDFRVHQLTLAARGRADAPFLRADDLHVNLPWSALTGRLAFQAIEVQHPTVTIVRDAGGATNLPSIPGTTGSASPNAIPIGALVIHDLQAAIVDEADDARLDVHGLSLDMKGTTGTTGAIAGRVALAAPAHVQWHTQQTSITTIDGRLAFDGSSIVADQLRVTLPEGTVQIDGRVASLMRAPQLALSLRGQLALARLSAWAALDPPVAGALAFTGRVDGPASDPHATVHIDGSNLSWADFHQLAVSADVDATRTAADIQSLRARLAGGTIDGRGQMTFGDAGQPGEAHLMWHGLQAGDLLAGLPGGTAAQVRSSFDGQLDARWTGLEPTAVALQARNRATAPPNAVDGLAGTIDVRLDGGRWQAAIDQRIGTGLRVSGTMAGMLRGGTATRGRTPPRHEKESEAADEGGGGWSDILQSSIAGRLTLASDDLPAAAQTVEALTGMAARPESITGTAQADVQLAGTFERPEYAGTFEAPDVRAGGVGPAALTASFSGSSVSARIERVDATLGPDTLHGSGAVNLRTEAVTGQIDGAIADLSRLAPLMPAMAQPAGALHLTAIVSGRWTDPHADATVSGETLKLAGQAFDRLSAKLANNHRQITIDHASLEQGQGRLALSGSYDLARERYTAQAAGRNLRIDPVPRGAAHAGPLPISAGADFDLSVNGTMAAPEGHGRIDLHAVTWDGFLFGDVHADLAAANRSLTLQTQVPDFSATAGGTLALGPSGAFTVEAHLAPTDVAPLVARLPKPPPIPVSGSIAVGLSAHGDLHHLRATAATIDLQRLDGSLAQVPIRLAAPAQIRYAGRAIDAQPIDLRLGGTTLQIGGTLGQPAGDAITATLRGNLRDLQPLLSLTETRAAGASGTMTAAGDIAIRATASGPLARPTLAGTLALRDAQVAVANAPPVTGLTLDATYGDGVLDLAHAAAVWQKAAITASGRLPARVFAGTLPAGYLRSLPPAASGPARFTAQFSHVTPDVLSPYLSASTLSQLGGQIAGTLTLEADRPTLAEAHGALTLNRADLTVGGIPLRQQEPTRLVLADGRLQAAAFDWNDGTSARRNRLTVRGSMALTGPRALDFDVQSNLDLRMLGAFSPDVTTAGRAELDAHVGGTAQAPALDGQLNVTNAELRYAKPELVVSGLSGAVQLAPTRITIPGLAGEANGGTLRISGSLDYAGTQAGQGAIAIDGRGLAFNLYGLRSEADAKLALGLHAGALALTGSVNVLRGAYRAPFTVTGGLMAALQQQGITITSGAPSMLDAMTLDVDVTTAQDLEVSNNYAQLEVGLDLSLVGTLARPGLTGRAAVREGGQIFLGGNTYRISGTGAVDFINPNAIEPDLDVTAVTSVAGTDITLVLSGTPQRLTTDLSSNASPVLSQAEIVSLLLTGRPVEQGSGAQMAFGSGQLLGYLSGEFLGTAGQALGLSTLRVERGLPNVSFDPSLVASETDPSSRLTFGKDVTSRLRLIFSQSLTDSGGLTWIASYMPSRTMDLRAMYLDDGTRRYDFMQEVNPFGAPATPAAHAETRPARIAAITFTGNPGFPPATLQSRLKLSVGDSFSFFRWQKDRDRLLAFYHDRGYAEAHVRADRSSADPLSLAYNIHRGPQTILTISGAPVPSGVRADMEEAWERSVFDGFLLDELQSIARAYLAGRGFLQPAVEAAVARASADTKEIVVHIDPGPRSRRRAIVFSGNARITTEELQNVVKDQRLTLQAWTDHQALENAILADYRNAGNLGAQVAVGAPRFAGDLAELPVTIQEGPVFRVRSVRFQGLLAMTSAAVSSALDLPPGAIYSPIVVQQAVGQVEALYRQSGFNTEHTSLQVSLDPASGAVDLTVTVDEGARQVLADVVTVGARRTDPDVVKRALDFTAGKPVSRTDWALARKRLYDTGAFKSVDIEAEPLAMGPAAPDADGVPTEPVRAQVLLEEWPPVRLRYGFQVQDEAADPSGRTLRPGVAADLMFRNLFGHAIALGGAGQLTKDFRAARTYITTPTMFGLPVTSNLFFERSRKVVTPSETDAVIATASTVTAEQRIAPKPDLYLTYSYSFERNHTFEEHPDLSDPFSFPFDLTVNIARLTTTALYDTRNDLVDSTRGLFTSSSFEYSTQALGSDLRFIKYLFQQRYFHPLAGGVVFATDARVGLARAFGQELVPSEKFFAGGGNSVRGYAESALGPADFLGPTGGDALLVLNEELRFPIFRIVRGVGFFDAGNVFPTIGAMSITGLDAAAGFGVRVNTPFVLLRVDYGIPLMRTTGMPFGRWFFSIGQAF